MQIWEKASSKEVCVLVDGRDYSLVQQIRDGIGILGQRRSEQHAFVEFAHFSQEFVDKRSFQNIHLVDGSVDFHGYNEIGVGDWLSEKKAKNRIWFMIDKSSNDSVKCMSN